MSPEPVKKVGLIPHLKSNFRYSGRTHYETRNTPIDRPPPKFERILSGPRLTSRSMDGNHLLKKKRKKERKSFKKLFFLQTLYFLLFTKVSYMCVESLFMLKHLQRLVFVTKL